MQFLDWNICNPLVTWLIDDWWSMVDGQWLIASSSLFIDHWSTINLQADSQWRNDTSVFLAMWAGQTFVNDTWLVEIFLWEKTNPIMTTHISDTTSYEVLSLKAEFFLRGWMVRLLLEKFILRRNYVGSSTLHCFLFLSNSLSSSAASWRQADGLKLKLHWRTIVLSRKVVGKKCRWRERHSNYRWEIQISD